jgi:protein SCO1/2
VRHCLTCSVANYKIGMRPRQTILLGLLLLVPVLAFLFLYGFGRNHYALPTYLPERADSVRSSAGGWQRDTVFHRVRPFRLRTAAGRVLTSTELSQGLYVVQFYTFGEASQPASQAMARLQEHFRPEARVRLLTLVPDAETVAATDAQLTKLNEQYGTISGKWFFGAAPLDTLRQLAQKEFGQAALRPEHLPFRPATEPGNLLPGRLLLVDNAQHVRGYYDAADKYEVERLITEINVLLYTYDNRD